MLILHQFERGTKENEKREFDHIGNDRLYGNDLYLRDKADRERNLRQSFARPDSQPDKEASKADSIATDDTIVDNCPK
jgi:hypothetical protein